MGLSVQRLKENKQRESGGSENNEKRKGDVCFEKKKASTERERGMAMEMEIISGDLRPWSCIEVCTADTSVMDFRMC